MLLPLPFRRGEGWGEGSFRVVYSTVSSVIRLRPALLALALTCLQTVPGRAEPQSPAPVIATAAADQTVPPGAQHLDTNSGPRIQFAEPVHDFGRVEYGKVCTNFFTFTNTGDQLLVLSDVISSCGCVAAQNWDRRV